MPLFIESKQKEGQSAFWTSRREARNFIVQEANTVRQKTNVIDAKARLLPQKRGGGRFAEEQDAALLFRYDKADKSFLRAEQIGDAKGVSLIKNAQKNVAGFIGREDGRGS